MRTGCAVLSARLAPVGFTLLEVVVALALFGLILGVSGLSLASLREPRGADAIQQLVAARDSAIRTGRPVSVTVTNPDTGVNRAPCTAQLLFLPDGRGMGAGVDQLTGAPLGTR
jgi:prepilin-type N-terminal cleavage/methylation domain-containing protein